jgi:RNA recognition motif-containing protein
LLFIISIILPPFTVTCIEGTQSAPARQVGNFQLVAIVQENSMNIFVGNLAEEVSDEDLRGVFEAFGQVESVNILKDRFSGKSKGFGFVEMPSKEEAEAAIKETNGSDLKGAELRVDEAHPRPAGGRRGGGGGGGGGHRGGGRRGGDSRRGGSGGGRGGSRGGRRSY